MTEKSHVYELPGEVAAAISTNRVEMMTMLINRVVTGYDIPRVQIIGLLKAFRDIVQMRADDNQRAQALERYVRHIDDATKGLDKLSTKIRQAALKIGSGEPLAPEELE